MVSLNPPLKRLLFVDDEMGWLSLLPRLLRGYEVVCACGGQEALKLLRSGLSFDLIFCDWSMPGLTGPDLLQILRQERPDQADLLVFLTGGSDCSRGFSHVILEKPLPVEQLRKFLRERLG